MSTGSTLAAAARLAASSLADPDWWRTAVVYQVYPRSFADSDGDGIGDLRGLIARLDYLGELGVDALWLSPFYPSPLADGGYDVADYRGVDQRLGTLADFDELVAAAHERGLRVVVDVVPNHSSSAHPWFQEALAAGPGSQARARYVFRDGRGADGELPPSDWRSHFGGSAWTRVPDGQWYLHLFAAEQPDFDWGCARVREEFLEVLRFWADRGVDGFRVDVAHGLAKDLAEPLRSQTTLDAALPLDGSDPLYDRDEVHEIYREWRQLFDSYDPPKTAVAEVWSPANARTFLYARPDELGQVFDFSLLKTHWDFGEIGSIVRRSLAGAAEHGGAPTWVLSNHDVPRHATRLGLPAGLSLDGWLASGGPVGPADPEVGLARARALTMMILALPGSPYLYQGEELGLPEVEDLAPEAIRDPAHTRSGGTFKGRDGCRVPLPWNTDAAAAFGFSSGAPWLPQPARFGASSVEAEEADPDSTLHLYRRALAIRRALRDTSPSVEWLDRPAESVLAFRRPSGLLCVLNLGEGPCALPPGELLLASTQLDAERLLPVNGCAWLGSTGEIAREATVAGCRPSFS